MSTSFLHGIETIVKTSGAVAINTVKTAVILLVGTAPVHNTKPADTTDEEWYAQVVNQPILITKEEDAAKYFGEATSGFTIPSALAAIFDHGSGPVIVVNVFNPTTHKTDTTPDVAKVVASDIVGAVDANGNRSGLQIIKNLYALYGFSAKIILCPSYCEQATVMAEMLSLAELHRCIAPIDAQAGLSVTQAITARGTGNLLNTASYRAILCYPRAKIDDALEPLSQRIAGVIAATDNALGYWYSPSNQTIQGITGMERPLSFGMADENSDLNLLNASGYVSIYNNYGSGYKVWGNRSAAFPTQTDPKVFIPVIRTSDVIAESIEYYVMKYLDKPINIAIDGVISDVNAFLRTLVGRGALIDGKCYFDKAQNSSAEMAAGHLVFTYEMMPPTPAERITFNQVINTDLLSTLLTSQS
jgi:phage tail sheath protein FI